MRVAIIGSNHFTDHEQEKFAFELAKSLVNNNYDIINGGMGGIMESTAKGARSSNNFNRVSLIAILPVENKNLGNEYSGIKIATHLGTGRNRLIILNSDAVIAIGGGAGTLSEISIAWEMGKPIAAFTKGKGWASKLANQKIDDRRSEVIIPLNNVDEAIDWIKGLHQANLS